MNQTLHDCINASMVLCLDLLIFSKNKETHYEHMKIVLSRLNEHELYALLKKCELMVTSKNEMELKLDETKFFKTWQKPTSVTYRKSFPVRTCYFR